MSTILPHMQTFLIILLVAAFVALAAVTVMALKKLLAGQKRGSEVAVRDDCSR